MLATWQRCECCDEFWCNVHAMHAFECPCPPVDEWETDPYSTPIVGKQNIFSGVDSERKNASKTARLAKPQKSPDKR